MRAESRGILLVVLAVVVVGMGVRSASTQDRSLRGTLDKALDSDGDLADNLTALDRQILEFVNDSQLEQLLDGTDPADIYLSNGETLQALTTRTQAASSRSLLFAPIAPCRLIDTRSAPEGRMLAGETRGFRVRESVDGYTAQGGSAEGCGLPGPTGMTLKTNTVRALALNVMTTEVGGPGSLAIWPANRSEPEIGSVSFAGALAGGGVTGGVLVPVCDEAGLQPCTGGDLKIKAKISGAHVVADVVGYFHAAGADLARISELGQEKDDADNVADESGRIDESTASTKLQAPLAQLQVQTPPRVSQYGPGAAPLKTDPAGPPPPYPVLPNPFGGHAKIRTAVSTGDAAMNVQHGIDAHLDNENFNFYKSAIRGTATTGNAIRGHADNGRAIYGQTKDGYAVYGFDGGSKPNRGYAGYFYSTNGIGVYGYSGANRTHNNIYAPGVYGQSNQGVGVYGRGDTSNSHSFYNEGGYFVGGRGIYARGTDAEFEGGSSHAGYGARFYSDGYRALYARGDSDDYDAHFDGSIGIIVDGSVALTAALGQLAVNAGTTPIEPGDLVAIAGVRPSPEDGRPMLAVARVDATNRHAVMGVAGDTHSATLATPVDGPEYMDFSPTEGAAQPLGYLMVVTRGLAPAVKAAGLAGLAGLASFEEAGGWRVGDKLALSTSGTLEVAAGKADSVSIGKVVSPLDPATGTVGLFVDVD